jgi:hypothetical protein
LRLTFLKQWGQIFIRKRYEKMFLRRKCGKLFSGGWGQGRLSRHHVQLAGV